MDCKDSIIEALKISFVAMAIGSIIFIWAYTKGYTSGYEETKNAYETIIEKQNVIIDSIYLNSKTK